MNYPLDIKIASRFMALAIGDFKVYQLPDHTFVVQNDETGFIKIYVDVFISEIIERIELLYKMKTGEDFESLIEYAETPED